MQLIYYPGNDRQVCRAQYAITLNKQDITTKAKIVAIDSLESGEGTPLYQADEGRDVLLNKILTNELRGVRIEFVSFYVVRDYDYPLFLSAIEFPIRLNIDDYVKKGNPHEGGLVSSRSLTRRFRRLVGRDNKEIDWNSWDVVGGCAAFFTKFDEGRDVPLDEITDLCRAVGYNSKAKAKADSYRPKTD